MIRLRRVRTSGYAKLFLTCYMTARAEKGDPFMTVSRDSCLEFFFQTEREDRCFRYEINPNGCLSIGRGREDGTPFLPGRHGLMSARTRRQRPRIPMTDRINGPAASTVVNTVREAGPFLPDRDREGEIPLRMKNGYLDFPAGTFARLTRKRVAFCQQEVIIGKSHCGKDVSFSKTET